MIFPIFPSCHAVSLNIPFGQPQIKASEIKLKFIKIYDYPRGREIKRQRSCHISDQLVELCRQFNLTRFYQSTQDVYTFNMSVQSTQKNRQLKIVAYALASSWSVRNYMNMSRLFTRLFTLVTHLLFHLSYEFMLAAKIRHDVNVQLTATATTRK